MVPEVGLPATRWAWNVIGILMVSMVAFSQAQNTSKVNKSARALAKEDSLRISPSAEEKASFPVGTNVTLTCSLISTDLVDFEWFLNGVSLESKRSLRFAGPTRSHSPHGDTGLNVTSYLQLVHFGRSHEGNYTCKLRKRKHHVTTLITVHPESLHHLDEGCAFDDHCATPMMMCSEGVCVCHPSYPIEMRRGKFDGCFEATRLGGFCFVNEQCWDFSPNTRCRVNTCECDDGYFEAVSKDQKMTNICVQFARYNESCQSDRQCTESHPEFVCRNGQCACANVNATFVETKRRCLKLEPLGSECRYDEECDDGYGLQACLNHVCACTEGFIASLNGTCILDLEAKQKKLSQEVYMVALAVGFCLALAAALMLLVLAVRCYRNGCSRTRRLKDPRLNRRTGKKTGQVVLVAAEASP